MIIRSNIVMILAVAAVLLMTVFTAGNNDARTAGHSVQPAGTISPCTFSILLTDSDGTPFAECFIGFRLFSPVASLLDLLMKIYLEAHNMLESAVFK